MNIYSEPFLPWEIIDEILVLAGNPRIPVVLERFFIVRRIDRDADFNWAIWHGRLEYLKYLNERGGYCNNLIFMDCVRNNRTDILKYCHENRVSEYIRLTNFI
jgi:hypothetical protein